MPSWRSCSVCGACRACVSGSAAPDEELLGKAAGYPVGTPANWFFDERVRVGSFSHLDRTLPRHTGQRPHPVAAEHFPPPDDPVPVRRRPSPSTTSSSAADERLLLIKTAKFWSNTISTTGAVRPVPLPFDGEVPRRRRGRIALAERRSPRSRQDRRLPVCPN